MSDDVTVLVAGFSGDLGMALHLGCVPPTPVVPPRMAVAGRGAARAVGGSR